MKKTGMIVMLAIFALGIAGATLAAAEVGVTDTTIKLGHFGDMSGPAAYIGEMVVGSTQAYIGMVNDEGGILGRKLELVIEDNKYDPTLTKSAFTKLVIPAQGLHADQRLWKQPLHGHFPRHRKGKDSGSADLCRGHEHV